MLFPHGQDLCFPGTKGENNILAFRSLSAEGCIIQSYVKMSQKRAYSLFTKSTEMYVSIFAQTPYTDESRSASGDSKGEMSLVTVKVADFHRCWNY